MYSFKDIRVVHLEISSRCNAACPECPRNLRGADIESLGNYPVHDMTLEEAKAIFSKSFLQHTTDILINGNFGDFVTCRDAVPIVEYFATSNPQLRIEISTNGSGQPRIWSRLAQFANVVVQFRIDGLQDTHHLYRQYTDFDLIMANAQRYINAGGSAEWHMIDFDFNQHQQAEAEQMSQALGFRRFKLINAGRNNTAVYNRHGEPTHVIGQPTHERDFEKLLATHVEMKNNPTFHQLNYYPRVPAKAINCRVQSPASIYVQSNGEVYPCCWIGHAPWTNTAKPGTDHTRSVCRDNNALIVGLESAMAWFVDLEKSWTAPSVLQGRNYTCNSVCGETLT
jgi:sulfatase maturation enzyme AslB (radical SAM superfamily)